jgi:gamma-glutamyltranspeptidase / glutathione hydrolase
MLRLDSRMRFNRRHRLLAGPSTRAAVPPLQAIQAPSFRPRLSLQCLRLILMLMLAPAILPAAPLQRGAAATVHPLATAAALNALERGGNAVDAAIAAALTLGIVDGYNSGIGGGCFILIRLADGSFIAIDGRETAPAGATREMFLRDGRADTKLSQKGALAVGVPGALAAYEHALRHHGKLALRELLLPAAQIAENGFLLDEPFARRIKATAEDLKDFPAAAEIFLHPDGRPRGSGELLKQPDLARTYRAIAREGIDWFYRGAFAEEAGKWMKENGGVMTAEDFARYRIRLREPIRTTYRDCEIVGFPPPSSGGVHVAQILNMLERFDLKALGAGSPDFVHVIAEAMKLAFADRAFWLGDPDFTPVPRGLVSKSYAKELAGRIRLDQAIPVPGHSIPGRAQDDIFGRHTTHFSTADREGNWVACTATINTTFGAKAVVPGTGVVLNNEMDDFALQPGVANAFGLVGAEANAVAPGKRPLSSMSPTIVLRENEPFFSVGAAGGPTIISQAVLALVLTIDFGLPPEAALAQPRFHHQWAPNELRIEKSAGNELMSALEKRGHIMSIVETIGVSQAIGKNDDQTLVAAREPRLKR